ncbi:protein translocase subunit SecF [Christensenella tenuis]|uniref:Protein-export membrane protein SecF n=1 Tax=Christensenella tenuis TaxID=2763033 RepID=A0ABR7EBE3_9FIRM|nr:protein translocase subunit SecF [Christensenella tenuis]
MITKHFKKFLMIPIVIIALGIIFGVINGGLNLGIDFTGGSIVSIDFKGEFETDVVQKALDNNGMGDSPIVKAGEGYTQAEIRMRTLDTDELQSTTNEAILTDIQQTYPDAEIVSVDKVGGVASSELVRNAFLAVAIACGLMLIYIWIRFQLYNGISAVVMLIHDVGIMIAIMCILQIQINSAFIAACLTIIGYSINNTIVVFDRVRDNLKVMGTKRFTRPEIADTSIKETLTRTINTSVTTLIMIVCLYIFGVPTIKEFSFPIIVGLLAGVYSSVLLAAPMWALLADRFDKKKQNAKSKAKTKKKAAKA